MGHHYIPQYYLNGFANSSRKIWVYEKGKSKGFFTGTKNVANERGFYSEKAESYLANEIENPANSVIKKIREQKNISFEDKLTLSKYMLVLYKRVPSGQKKMKDRTPEIFDKVLNDIQSELAILAEQHPDILQLKNRQEEATIFRNRIKEDGDFANKILKDTWLGVLPPNMTPESIKALSMMTWQFLVYEKDAAFLTNDNPLFFFRDIGIGNINSEVTFPISSHIVLFASWKQNLKETYIKAKQSDINEINRRTANNMTRFVFHSANCDWIIRLINKKTRRLRKLNIAT